MANFYSASTLVRIADTIERMGFSDPAVTHENGVWAVWATTSYLADGSPIMTEIAWANSPRELEDRVLYVENEMRAE